MTTGRENVTRAICFANPEHMPVHIEVNFNWLEPLITPDSTLKITILAIADTNFLTKLQKRKNQED